MKGCDPGHEYSAIIFFSNTLLKERVSLTLVIHHI